MKLFKVFLSYVKKIHLNLITLANANDGVTFTVNDQFKLPPL